MASIGLESLRRTLESCSVDNDRFSVKFTALPLHSPVEEDGTRLFYLTANVGVVNKETKEEASFYCDILKVPEHGDAGFQIKGKSKQIVSNYERAHGWYVADNLALHPQYGYRYQIVMRDYCLYVTRTGKVTPRESVPLSIFLKALTGNSFVELVSRLGDDNIYIARTFSVEEPTQIECVTRSLFSLFDEYKTPMRMENYERLSADAKTHELRTRVFSRKAVYIGLSAGARMRKMFSYAHRALGMHLDEDLELNGLKFAKGRVLDYKILEQIDYLPIDTLVVTDEDGRRYSLRKDGTHSFQALGATLLEGIDEDTLNIPAGTVLDVTLLKILDATDIREIYVSVNGKEQVMKRKVFDGAFHISDFMGAIQVFVDGLMGVPFDQNTYGPENQIVINIDTLASDYVRTNCGDLIQSLFYDDLNLEGAVDLLTKIEVQRPLAVDLLIEYIESAKSIEVQQAELNNTIQRLAKEEKVSKNVSRNTPEMTSVQHGQFGMLDAIESPESSKIGTVHSKTYMAGLNKEGYLTIALIPVKNGEVVSTKPIHLTANEREGEFIAQWNETFKYTDENGIERKKEKIFCMSSTSFLEVPIEEVRYKQIGPFDNISVSRMASPYIEHNQLKRLVMNGNHTKQAKTLINRERSAVSSGGESLLAEHGIIYGKEVLSEFYQENKSDLGTTWDEFQNRKLTLRNIEKSKGYKILALSVEGVEGTFARARIPFMQKSASGSLYGYEINVKTGLVFTKDDIVAHAMDIDTGEYELDLRVDLGHMEVDHKVFDNAIGMSRNLIVGFKTFEASNMDDSILLNNRLSYDGSLDSIEVSTVEYELALPFTEENTNIVTEEAFGSTSSSSSITKLQCGKVIGFTGVVPVGTPVFPGDPLIVYHKTKKRYTGKGTPSVVESPADAAVYMDHTEPGQVVESYVEGIKATVKIARWRSIEEGDKMTGRHGNKGVVGRLVPHEEMPYDPETGLVLDICLSPMGLPSRMNIGQTIEAYMGLVMYKKGWEDGKKHVHIVTPFQEDNLGYVLDRAHESGVKPIMLRDGRTGSYFKRPVAVGRMYMLVSEHAVSHKMKAVGLRGPLDPVFGQPSKGKGGQALGEMETWALEEYGARRMLQDAMSVQSDDIEAIKTMDSAIQESPYGVDVVGENKNDLTLSVLYRCLGTEVTYDSEGNMGFRPLTDADIRSLCPTEMDTADRTSLSDPQIFGVSTSIMLRNENKNKWGWMSLGCEIVHPVFLIKGKLLQLIRCSRYQTKKGKIVYNAQGERLIEYTNPTLDMVWDVLLGKMGILMDRSYPLFTPDFDNPKTQTGMSAIVSLLRTYNIETTVRFIESKYEGAKTESSRSNHLKDLATVKDFIASGVKLSDFVTSTLPVMPKAFRPEPKFSHKLQDFDQYYSRIMSEVTTYKMSPVKTEEGKYQIFLRIAEFCGLKNRDYIPNNSKDYKPLIKYFTGREGQDSPHGKIREKQIKKRQFTSGRSVIIPTRDLNRPINKIGVPFLMITEILEQKLVSYMFHLDKSKHKLAWSSWEMLIRLIATNKYRFLKEVINLIDTTEESPQEFYNWTYKCIKGFVEGYKDPKTLEEILPPQTALNGRQPTLHRFGMSGLETVIVEGKCIEVHPINNKGENADHDGDQKYIIFPQNDLTMQEVREKLSPKHNVLNPRDRSLILDFTQDMLLGIYFGTMLKNNAEQLEGNEEIYFYNSLDVLQADIDHDMIQLHDLVCISYLGNSYISTAGRILFNACLPEGEGFTDKKFSNPLNIQGIGKPESFCDLRFDGLVTGGKGLSNKIKYISSKQVILEMKDLYDPDTNLDALSKMTAYGFKYCDLSGISFALEDVVQNPYTQVLLDKAKEVEHKIDEYYNLGFLSFEERKAEIVTLYQKCKDKITKKVISDMDRNNSIFLMLESGARGNVGQLMQLSGIIGILQKSKDEVLETPITTNYGVGVSDFQMQQISYSTRLGIANTQNETSKSGQLTRQAVNMNAAEKIVIADCGAEPEGTKLLYMGITGLMISPKGEKLSPTDLVGKVLREGSKLIHYVDNLMASDRVITHDVLDILTRKRAIVIDCEDGDYHIHYEPNNTQKSQLLFRYTDEDLPDLIDDHYMSEKTIDFLYRTGRRSVRYRNLFMCKAENGLCSVCYGLGYSDDRLPEIGKAVGITAAQSLGEPASQLTMNLVHSAGEAGKGIDKGVNMYTSILQSGFYKKLSGALLAPSDGFVEILPNGKLMFRSLDNETEILVPKSNILVTDKEFVEKFEPLTSGLIVPSKELYDTTLEDVRFRQMALLVLHHNVYAQNGIEVLARHFETLVRNQLGFGLVMESGSTDFEKGKLYPVTQLLDARELGVRFSFKSISAKQVIRLRGGLITYLVHEDFATKLANIVTTGTKSSNNSFIGEMAEGSDVSKGVRKIIKTTNPKSEHFLSVSEDDSSLVDNEKLEKVVEIVEATETDVSDIDWDSMFGDDTTLTLPEANTEEIEEESKEDLIPSLSFEEEDEEEKDTPSTEGTNLGKSSSFGG